MKCGIIEVAKLSYLITYLLLNICWGLVLHITPPW